MKNIALLGSTGSIGRSTLSVVKANPEMFRICAISAKGNISRMEEQIREFRPGLVSIFDPKKAKELEARVKDLGVRVEGGLDGLRMVAKYEDADLVVLAVVGAVGLLPLIDAIKAGKQIAIANKEVLVMAGGIIMGLAKEKGIKIVPVDSEHMAIFQCLEGHGVEDVKRVILTASGGPFLRTPQEELHRIRLEDALNHPRWDMGRKISIDSATLMNKGFEVIEASHLFHLPLERISILIHPESVVHSLVEFVDGSLLAQLSIPDMRIPIAYALSYPDRVRVDFGHLDLSKIRTLHFEEVPTAKFPCLRLALEAAKVGGTSPAVLSASNEVATSLFLEGKIPFTRIPQLIEAVLRNHTTISNPGIEEILEADAWAREEVKSLI